MARKPPMPLAMQNRAFGPAYTFGLECFVDPEHAASIDVNCVRDRVITVHNIYRDVVSELSTLPPERRRGPPPDRPTATSHPRCGRAAALVDELLHDDRPRQSGPPEEPKATVDAARRPGATGALLARRHSPSLATIQVSALVGNHCNPLRSPSEE